MAISDGHLHCTSHNLEDYALSKVTVVSPNAGVALEVVFVVADDGNQLRRNCRRSESWWSAPHHREPSAKPQGAVSEGRLIVVFVFLGSKRCRSELV